MASVEGKVAFVTGGARGQGRNHALRLAGAGADVIIVDHCADVDTVPYPLATDADLTETAEAVRALGRRVVAVRGDVRDYEALSKAVAEGVGELGRLDVVVANAGILSFGETVQLTEQHWRDVIDTNLTGAWHTAKVATPYLLGGGEGGSMVFICSVAGLKGMRNIGHYVAAKHGMVGLMRTLAIELAPHRIRVNTVHSTNVDTGMIQNPVAMGLFVPYVENPTREQAAAVLTSLNALPVPWVEADDVSNAVLFFASDEARYVTGCMLTVDAGFTVK